MTERDVEASNYQNHHHHHHHDGPPPYGTLIALVMMVLVGIALAIYFEVMDGRL